MTAFCVLPADASARLTSMSTLDVMSSLAWLFVGLVAVPTTIWITLAIYCHVRWLWLRWYVSSVPFAAVGQSKPGSAAARALGSHHLAGRSLVIAIAWWISLRPRSDRDWMVGMEVLPRVEIVGDTLHVRQFRNFSYSATGEPIPRYEERT